MISDNNAIGMVYDDWRLPSARSNPQFGPESTSEMGHLYYSELGFSYRPHQEDFLTAEELNNNEFDNLVPAWCWTGTEYVTFTDRSWGFSMYSGGQGVVLKNDTEPRYALAVHSGQVPVPEPTTMLLMAFGSGIMGAGIRRLRKKKRN